MKDCLGGAKHYAFSDTARQQQFSELIHVQPERGSGSGKEGRRQKQRETQRERAESEPVRVPFPGEHVEGHWGRQGPCAVPTPAACT